MADDGWLPAGSRPTLKGCTRCGGVAWDTGLHDATFHPNDRRHEPNEEQA